MRVTLTPRQQQILELVAAGLGDKEIARELGVSTNTVRTHLQRYYREHQVKNRAEAAAGWISIYAAPRAAPEPPPAPVVAAPAPAPPPAAVAGRWRTFRFATAGAFVLLVAAIVTLGYQPAIRLVSGRAAPAAAMNQADAVTTLSTGAAQHRSESSPAPAAAANTPSATGGDSMAAPGVASQAPVAAAPASAVAHPASPAVTVTQATEMLAIVNADRAGAATTPLAWNSCLASVAARSAQRLASIGYVQATSGPSLDAACGLGSKTAEDAAYWSKADAAQLNGILMANPTERANILGPYHGLGAAWGTTSAGVAFLVLEFA